MPVDDWICMGCGAETLCVFRKGADILVQTCHACGDPMSINFSNRNFNHGDEGEFHAYYMETAPPDPSDPTTKMGRWIRSKADLRRLEGELAQGGAFIKGGRNPDTIPLVKEQRRNISNHGEEYFKALDTERRQRAKQNEEPGTR